MQDEPTTERLVIATNQSNITQEDDPTSEDPAWVYEYANGAKSTVVLYKQPVPDAHVSDRIELSVQSADDHEPFAVILMHALEAVDIINALSSAVAAAVSLDLPLH